MNQEYRVNLEVFEGPMDLLLYLIKKNDLNITDIPIAFILEEYLKYLDSLQEMNIDLAGDFLLTASELAYIKSQMLLPQDQQSGDEEAQDPRADLVRRLLEYQRYKEAAKSLLDQPQLNRDTYLLGIASSVRESFEEELKAELRKTDVYELLDAFARILIRIPKEQFHNVMVDRISVNDRIRQLIDLINQGEVITIEDLLEKPLTRYNVVITFLALLEMTRLKLIHIYQPDYASSICVKGVMKKVEEGDVLDIGEEA